MPGRYYGYYYYDPTYMLIVISALISLFAQFLVNSRFSKYSRVRSRSGMTGAQAAERILQSQGIYDVAIQRVSGKLTDHYNPRNKTLNLSDAVYASTSVAAVGVAAHECGHAIQHARGYAPLSFRSALVPVANIGSQLSWLFDYSWHFLWRQSYTDYDWYSDVFGSGIVSACDASGRI